MLCNFTGGNITVFMFWKKMKNILCVINHLVALVHILVICSISKSDRSFWMFTLQHITLYSLIHKFSSNNWWLYSSYLNLVSFKPVSRRWMVVFAHINNSNVFRKFWQRFIIARSSSAFNYSRIYYFVYKIYYFAENDFCIYFGHEK